VQLELTKIAIEMIKLWQKIIFLLLIIHALLSVFDQSDTWFASFA